MELFKKTSQIPFMATRRYWYVVSAILILGSIGLLATRGLNFGIDFTGGVVLEFAFPETADLDRIRGALGDAGYGDAQVQNFGTSRDIMVRVLPREDRDTNQISAELQQTLRALDPDVELRRTEVVGPQVGKELTEQGGLAMLFTFVMILIYVGFRFEKKLAIGAVLAAMHDPIVILGFFAATQITFDLSVLAALLAVIGYSLNDTVVVFDRVRENFLGMRKAEPAQILDASINQTLSRTLITSGATLLVVLVLLLVGGETLKGFSIALVVGIVVGTYSSIYIASALALEMNLTARDLMPPQKDSSEIDALP
jgi:preprotein translocase subunit SecF